jgi:hypothetical protein
LFGVLRNIPMAGKDLQYFPSLQTCDGIDVISDASGLGDVRERASGEYRVS